MPENDQPRWPTGDEDTSSQADRATSRLPLPKRDAGATAQLSVPNVTPGDGPGSWFRPNVPPKEVPGLNAPSDAPMPPAEPPRSNLADRVSGTAVPRPEDAKPRAPWVPVEGPTRFAAGVPRPGDTAGRPNAEGAAEKTFQASQQQPRLSAESDVSPGQGGSQQSSPAWQAPRKPGNSLFEPAGSGSAASGEEQGWNPFQSGQPAEPAEQQFAAFRDETPGTGENNQGWAAFRPVVARDEQAQEPAKEGWTAFRNDSAPAADPAQPGRAGDGAPESARSVGQAQPGRAGDDPKENWTSFRGESGPVPGSAAARLNPGQPGRSGSEPEGGQAGSNAGQGGRSGEGWPGASAGQSGRSGSESQENRSGASAGQSGRSGNESREGWPGADAGQPARPGSGSQESRSGASAGQPGRAGSEAREGWPGADAGQPGQPGSGSQENRAGSGAGQSGRAGNESRGDWPGASAGQSGRSGGESQEEWAGSNAGQAGRSGEGWPAAAAGQSGRSGSESQEEQASSQAGQPGRSGDGTNRGESEPWSQQIEIPVRPALPEPPPGTVPSASSGQVRPMRIDPAGGQFPAEATVGIPRPAEGFPAAPGAEQGPSEATVGIPRPAEGFGDRPGPEQIPPSAAAEQSPPEPPAGAGPVPPAEDAPKKPRRKALVLALVVLLLLAAAGGASAVPAVSNRLGLPWAPNAPKGSAPDPVDASLALHGPDTSGQGPSANGVAAKLSGPAGSPALSQLTGSVIDPASGTVLWDHASNTPLTPASTTKILTVAAALLAMEPTKRISTKIVQGAQPGTVVIVGGGDPSLTALPVGTDSPLYPGAAHVDDLVNQAKKAGVDIKKVQLDASAYSGPNTAPGWEPGDAPSLYGAPIVPAMTDGGRGNPNVDETMRSANPGTALTQLVAEKLGASPAGPAKAPEGAKVLGEVQSAPLPDLAYALLQISDNVLADALGRQVAMATGGEASFAGAAAAVKKVLADHGFDVNGLQLFDTSGLSNQNKVPARLLAQVLAAAAGPDGKDPNTPKLRPLLAGLPVAGSPEGTLHGRYHSAETQGGKGWVRAKTGTLTGVNTLAGYVLDSDNRVLAFAFMSNGSEKNSGQAALDVLATALRGCGCG
ncbi:D-alanyl-D-alanine carboxypeptidase/D-alanyl-D-alanine endopeptidase [Amycolatopsis orientalis]|uniref:D-alanyl-D-alanine carboxypeptidase/D-alanyl-D-alanine endopeptidase n=1 Tax=Amycolatopsis orientalis TaxID=31958 RepID=UPI001F2B91D4|nr:D-alanyl-D-alanine carboxypeptidase/D-alanyl-D-alanine-endopeptidase [Amycolatopsis orientalis]